MDGETWLERTAASYDTVAAGYAAHLHDLDLPDASWAGLLAHWPGSP